MRNCYAIILAALACLPIAAHAWEDFEITAQTTDCAGQTGFASFYTSEIHKISEGSCLDPNDPSKNLKFVMVRSQTLQGSYDAVWMTADEADNVMAQIREVRNAKLRRYERPDVQVEIITNGGQPDNTPAVATAGPTIAILDPTVAATRSIAEVLTSANLVERLVVGKVDAPAGLVSITVNGEESDFDDNGVFKSRVALNQARTLVDIVAVDSQGKKKGFKFHIVKDEPQTRSSQTLPKEDSDSGEFGQYHALIIANTNYKHLDKLVTPQNDAAQLTDVLANKYGFKVRTVENANRYDLVSALNDMREQLTEKDNLLIYYAGHGTYDKTNNRGHWLPIDAEPDSTANWVSNTEVTDIINSMSAKHILLVADSCYSGALTRSTDINLDAGMSEDARAKWLRKMAEVRSRHLLTSGGVKPVLDDGGDGHSVFASALLEVLRDSNGVIESSSVYQQVKRKVEIRARELNVDQSPMYAKLQEDEHEFGEFLLVEHD